MLSVRDRTSICRGSYEQNAPQLLAIRPAACRRRHTERMPDSWGIADGYHAVDGAWHDTREATREALRTAMGRPVEDLDPVWGDAVWFVVHGTTAHLPAPARLVTELGEDRGVIGTLPADLAPGYHTLRPDGAGPETWLVVHPETCPAPPHGWGVAAQVYSLWRPDGWGIGDLADVGALGAAVAARRGSVVLLSPLHAHAPTLPQEPSPYYPSSRRWLDPLLIPIDGMPPASIDNSPGRIVDRDAVWAAKRDTLELRFATERARPDWQAWAAEHADLDAFCTFNALADAHGSRWQEWPEHLRRPVDASTSADVKDPSFVARHAFHGWCQWLVRHELDRAAQQARRTLIGDLAVGCSPDGADAWIHQDLMALGVRIGAPPDPFNLDGQDWGLPPFVPWRLRRACYAPFIAMLRSALTSMAGLRVDHVMGLFRQFWIPAGGGPAEGAYVHLPAEELLAIVCLEAHRAGAYVVGEDLGTVQPEVRAALRATGILGTKVWLFDTDVAAWPSSTLGTATTHDLPTLTGVWDGEGTTEMHAALERAVRAAWEPLPTGPTSGDVLVAVHDEIARSAAVLTLATVDDLAGSTVRPNRPGTIDPADGEVPNWCVRMSATPEEILAVSPGADIVAVFSARTAANAD